MAFFDCPRGHRVPRRLACFQARALPYRLLLPPEIERLKEPDGHRREMVPKDGQTLSQRRSSWNVLRNIPAFIGSGALCRVASVSARRSVYSSSITAHKIS